MVPARVVFMNFGVERSERLESVSGTWLRFVLEGHYKALLIRSGVRIETGVTYVEGMAEFLSRMEAASEASHSGRVQHWGQNPVGFTQQVTEDRLQRSYVESMSRNRTEECHGRQGNWVRLQECTEGGGREMDLRLWRQISGSQADCLAGIFGFFMSTFDLTMNATEIFPFSWQSGCPQTLQLLSEGSFVTRMVANISMTLHSCLGHGCLDCIHHLP